MNEVFQLTTDFILQFSKLLFDYLEPFLGVLVGAWLASLFKRREWKWEKERWAKDLFYETVSRISFLVDNYAKGEYEEKFSMSGLGLDKVDDEIKRLIKELHAVGHQLKLYLKKSDFKLFQEYLVNTQEQYDLAKESYGRWYPDDSEAIEAHTENTVAEQGRVAKSMLRKLNMSFFGWMVTLPFVLWQKVRAHAALRRNS